MLVQMHLAFHSMLILPGMRNWTVSVYIPIWIILRNRHNNDNNEEAEELDDDFQVESYVSEEDLIPLIRQFRHCSETDSEVFRRVHDTTKRYLFVSFRFVRFVASVAS